MSIAKNMHYVAHMEFKGIKGQMEFGEKIKTRRCELGLSQTELASVCGISLRSVQNYESGQRHPANIVIVRENRRGTEIKSGIPS